MAGEHRIKSAMEIALEKADKLGNFTTEEAQQHRENQYRPTGEALGRKLMAGMTARDLAIDVDKLPPEGRDIARRSALEYLASLIDVNSLDDAEAAALALEVLTRQTKVRDGVKAVVDDYRQAREARLRTSRPALERAARQELEKEGFGGPALQVIPERSLQWRQSLDKLDNEYRERFAAVREPVMKLPLPQ